MIKDIERYKLYNDDCLKVMRDEIEDKKIDLILCDLPYNMTNCKWDKMIDLDELWKQYERIIKPTGVIVLFSSQPFTTELIYSNKKNYKYSWYWIKNTSTGHIFSKYQPMRKVEDINVFYKKMPTYIPQGLIKLDEPVKAFKGKRKKEGIYSEGIYGKEYIIKYTNYPKNVLYFDKEVNCIHPCQKPLELIQYLIKTYTKEDDLVLDNCYGSGQTGVGCANTNRRFIGIELEKEHFENGKNRIISAYYNTNKNE
ncbi:DNA-methyltransferase [Clostridioides difficile]|uniref:DNA-methyltransferase n=1 Tax=Clostridioides difficile TaxID=1496 RepID=UPI001F37B8C0|nr:site-specific DNA-methyltransferase [Clostridioides difficile]